MLSVVVVKCVWKVLIDLKVLISVVLSLFLGVLLFLGDRFC